MTEKEYPKGTSFGRSRCGAKPLGGLCAVLPKVKETDVKLRVGQYYQIVNELSPQPTYETASMEIENEEVLESFDCYVVRTVAIGTTKVTLAAGENVFAEVNITVTDTDEQSEVSGETSEGSESEPSETSQEASEGSKTEPGETSQETSETSTVNPGNNNPRTGDTTSAAAAFTVLLGSLAAVLLAKHRRKDEAE